MKFACVDGADFDGHLVNFDELALRQRRFVREEKEALDRYRSEADTLAGLNGKAPALKALVNLPEAQPALRPVHELTWKGEGLHLRLTAQGPWDEAALRAIVASIPIGSRR